MTKNKITENNMINNSKEIPLWEKWTLTVKESAKYFGIGENTIRRIIDENSDSDFVLRVGKKWLIKRCKFETFLDNCQIL